MSAVFNSVEEAIQVLRAGGMIILRDDEHRENEGDLVLAAEHVSAETINFMTRYGRGLICLPMSETLIDKLELPLMTAHNRSPYRTAFTVSIEAATGVSTGISAADRAHTIRVAVDPHSSKQDIISPGHVFPLRARALGVLERAGQTEGSVDLMRLAGLTEAAVICEILNEDGSMSRVDSLEVFSKEYNIPLLNISDIIQYRIQHETLVRAQASIRLPLEKYGDFSMSVFTDDLDDAEHLVLVKPYAKDTAPLVRIHSECITGDLFGSMRCDCGAQLDHSLERISTEGGVLIYLRQEGRGIGLSNKLKAYALQEQGYDTVEANIALGLPADKRNYGIAYQLLKYFGINKIRLLTNNPQKIESIQQYGVSVERESLIIEPTNDNCNYLKAKQEKLGHLLSLGAV
ncbi:MAG: GTP cyclohydrolase II [Legionellaceae bacterium]|nr:GTP cyclohydrolase II [Legionellaceae bacterium]